MPTGTTSKHPYMSVIIAAGTVLLVAGHAAGKPAVCESGGTLRVGVAVKPPAGKTLAGVVVDLDYPEEALRIPGNADQPDVKARISGVPEGFLASPNDLDDDLVVALVGTRALPPGATFKVEFDRCKGAPKVAAKDFRCKVEQASTDAGALVDGSTCTVTIDSDTVKKAKEGSL